MYGTAQSEDRPQHRFECSSPRATITRTRPPLTLLFEGVVFGSLRMTLPPRMAAQSGLDDFRNDSERYDGYSTLAGT
jgi:hypothetical protein